MSTTLAALVIGIAHAAYIYGAYATGLVGDAMPFYPAIAIWIGLPSLVAAYFYWRTSARIAGFARKFGVRTMCVIAWLFSSTFAGMFLALRGWAS